MGTDVGAAQEHRASIARVIALRVGLPQEYVTPRSAGAADHVWSSGIRKEPVEGPRWLTSTGFEGDGQGDLVAHGGIEQAVLLIGMGTYRFWDATLGAGVLQPGTFGENLLLDDLDEANACVGDVYAVGDALLEVSNPRKPCWKLARHTSMPQLPRQVTASGRGGWYVRVLQEGNVAAGDELRLEMRPFPQWTIERINAVRYGREAEPQSRAALARCPALSRRWRDWFARDVIDPD